jgi:predicted SAM-dependent methyltransferase
MKLNLGCGKDYRKGFVNVDIDRQVKADFYADAFSFLKNLPAQSVDYIWLGSSLEHLPVHLKDFFKECHRVLDYNGVLHFVVPNPFFWRTRIKFLFGKFEWCGCWHPWHTHLVKPSWMFDELRWIGFCPEFVYRNNGITSLLGVDLAEDVVEIKAINRKEFEI